MKNLILCLFTVLFGVTSNKCYSCNKESVFIKIDRQELLKYSDIEMFMLYFSNSYDDDIEISEYRNEILLKLLAYVDPCLFIKALSNQSETVVNSILLNIRHPINDQINISEILRNVNSWKKNKTISKADFMYYKKIVSALKFSLR